MCTILLLIIPKQIILIACLPIQLLSRFRNHDSILLILIGCSVSLTSVFFFLYVLKAERDDMEDSPASALVTLCPVNIDLCFSLASNYY